MLNPQVRWVLRQYPAPPSLGPHSRASLLYPVSSASSPPSFVSSILVLAFLRLVLQHLTRSGPPLHAFASYHSPPAHQERLWRSSNCSGQASQILQLGLLLWSVSLVSIDPAAKYEFSLANVGIATILERGNIQLYLHRSTTLLVSTIVSCQKLLNDSEGDPV